MKLQEPASTDDLLTVRLHTQGCVQLAETCGANDQSSILIGNARHLNSSRRRASNARWSCTRRLSVSGRVQSSRHCLELWTFLKIKLLGERRQPGGFLGGFPVLEDMFAMAGDGVELVTSVFYTAHSYPAVAIIRQPPRSPNIQTGLASYRGTSH